MKKLSVNIDLRCCNEKKVSTLDFQDAIKNKLPQYNIKFYSYQSDLDVICTNGHGMFEIENPTKNDSDYIQRVLENTFHNLCV